MPQTMPKPDHDRRRIPVTMAVLLPGDGYQVADFGFRQVLPASAELVIVSTLGHLLLFVGMYICPSRPKSRPFDRGVSRK
jgi:hypothetical protein